MNGHNDNHDNSTVKLVQDNHDIYDVFEFTFRIASPDLYSLETQVVGIAMTAKQRQPTFNQ
jgi:hypothetical protein